MKLSDITTEDLTNLVGLLTIEQKDQLVGTWYTSNRYYNPIQDINDNWIISVQEMQNTTNPNTLWVKDLDLITYEPKPTSLPF